MDEVFRALGDAGVRYLLIGGQAMRLMGMPRYSMDWDLFIPARDEANLQRLNSVLADELDMVIEPLGSQGENFVQTFQTRWGVLQFHLGLPGVPQFEEAEARSIARSTESGQSVRCICGEHLLAAKEAANRAQDQEDIEFLRELKKAGKL